MTSKSNGNCVLNDSLNTVFQNNRNLEDLVPGFFVGLIDRGKKRNDVVKSNLWGAVWGRFQELASVFWISIISAHLFGPAVEPKAKRGRGNYFGKDLRLIN